MVGWSDFDLSSNKAHLQMHNIASGLSKLLKSFDLSYLYEWICFGKPQFEFEKKNLRDSN